MMKLDPKKRRRLSPEVRKNQILDVAAQFIRENGVSALSMDGLGREAGVSKPLIYNYFQNRIDLLRSLLQREVHRFHQSMLDAAERAETLEELIRLTSRSMLHHVRDYGIVIDQLMHEPDVADALHDMETRHHEQYAMYLRKRMRREFGMSPKLAEATIAIALGLSSSAGAFLEKHNANIDFVEDMLVTMLMGSVQSTANAARAGNIRTIRAKRQAVTT
ncbi:MAG: TetR/AcrR family transcriptional regulator [Pseudomonadota bacterium]